MQDTFVSFEQALLRKALRKHVHRLDIRKGISRHKVPKEGEDHRHDGRVGPGRRTLVGERKSIQDWDDELSVHRRRSTRRRTMMEADESDLRRQHEKKELDGALHGSLELQAPAFKSGTARCRISKCINLGSDSNEEDLKNFLKEYCEWKPVDSIGVGNMKLPRQNERPCWDDRRAATADADATRGSRFPAIPEPPRSAPLGADGRYGRRCFEGKGMQAEIGSMLDRFCENDELSEDEWTFLRHFPMKVVPAEEAQTKRKTLIGKKEVQPPQSPQMKIIFSDLRAVLRERIEHHIEQPRYLEAGSGTVHHQHGESEEEPPSLTVEGLIEEVPHVTKLRWCRLLSVDGLPRHLDALPGMVASALVDEPKSFVVVPQTVSSGAEGELVVDGQAVVKLAQSAPSAVSGSGRGRRRSLAEDQSHGGRLAREARFLGTLKAVGNLSALATWVEHTWGFTVDVYRLAVVSSALDRSESLRLCGGLMGAGERLHLNNVYRGTAGLETVTRASMLVASQKRPVRRGKVGLTADWLLATMSEQSDDENFEEGDAIRLLAEVVSEATDEEMSHAFSRRSIKAPLSSRKEDGALSEDSWVLVCQSLGLLRLHHRFGFGSSPFQSSSGHSSPRESVVHSPIETAAEGNTADTEHRKTLPLPSLASVTEDAPSRRSSAQPERPRSASSFIDRKLMHDQAEKEAKTNFSDVQMFHLRCTQWDNSLEPAFAPLVLETLLQKCVFDNLADVSGGKILPNGAGALAASLLWHFLGWDSPIGRRLIRRLSVVFLTYSTDGMMSRPGFLRFCTDAGWITARDLKDKRVRFSNAFTQVVSQSRTDVAQFPDFILLVEIAGSWRAGPPSSEPPPPLYELPGEAREWPALESVVLHVTGTSIKPTAPEPDWDTLAKIKGSHHSLRARGASTTSQSHSSPDSTDQPQVAEQPSIEVIPPSSGPPRSRHTTATPVTDVAESPAESPPPDPAEGSL